MKDRAELEKFATRYAKAWCSHDPDAVVAFYGPNASISVNDGPPKPIVEIARSFMRDFPDMIVTFDKLEPRDNEVAFHWTSTHIKIMETKFASAATNFGRSTTMD